ncbi:MAG: GldG family protein [Alphaproteobacteria bacterium]
MASEITKTPMAEPTRLDARSATAVTISLLVVLFLAVNLISNVGLRNARVDLTENSLFTLSEGTLNTIRTLAEPVHLQFFYSEKIGADYPTIRAYASRVRDLLEEYETRSGGNIQLDVIEPEPFSESEDLASAHGLTGAQTQGGDMLFFGLVGTNAIDGKEVIPFFAQERAPFLEYDLTELIYKLNTLEKPKLGVLSSLPLETGPGGMQALLQGNSQPLILYQQLQERFDIETLPDAFDRVPETVDILLIAHPRPLTEETLYAIDQFVLRGGRALVFVDPQSGFANQGNQFGQQAPGGPPESSDLGPLLETWGVKFDPGKVVGDLENAQVVGTQIQGRQARASYPIWLGLESGDVDPDDLVTADIESLNLATAGHLEILEDAATTVRPLALSSSQSMLFDRLEVAFQPQPEDLLRKFVETGTRYTLAVRITGTASSAYPDGAPGAVDPEVTPGAEADSDGAQTDGADGEAAGEGKADADKADADADRGDDTDPDPMPAHRAASDGPINVIVVADADLFDDRFWVVEQNLLGQRLAIPTADNANFVVNAVDNLTGSNDLISLRSRASGERPFTVVENMRRQAEGRYLAREQELMRRVEATEARLAELEGQRDPTDPDAVALLSPEQQRLVEQFRQQMIEDRRELRSVQRSLRADIETLGGVLAFINIALVPLVLTVVAIALARMRHKRRAERLRTGGR